jgi:hypothetical protein
MGRKALSDGVGVHDMAAIQHRALLKSLMRVRTREESSSTLRAASRFIVESLLPFEMSHRRSQEVNAALRESEERYRSVVDTARDIIFTLSPDGRILSMNPASRRSPAGRAPVDRQDFSPLVHRTIGRAPPRSTRQAQGAGAAALGWACAPNPALPFRASSSPRRWRAARASSACWASRATSPTASAPAGAVPLNKRWSKRSSGSPTRCTTRPASCWRPCTSAWRHRPRSAGPGGATSEDVRGLLDKIEGSYAPVARPSDDPRRPGLGPALEFLADGVSKRTGLAITAEASPGKRLPAPAETALYRIVQESADQRHEAPQATRVYIKFMRNRRFLRGVIRDDGVGFDVPAVLTRRASAVSGSPGSASGCTPRWNPRHHRQPAWRNSVILTVPVEADNAESDTPR